MTSYYALVWLVPLFQCWWSWLFTVMSVFQLLSGKTEHFALTGRVGIADKTVSLRTALWMCDKPMPWPSRNLQQALCLQTSFSSLHSSKHHEHTISCVMMFEKRIFGDFINILIIFWYFGLHSSCCLSVGGNHSLALNVANLLQKVLALMVWARAAPHGLALGLVLRGDVHKKQYGCNY